MHPSRQIEREYMVRILGKVENDILLKLTAGVSLEDGDAKFEKIVDAGGEGANHWYRVTLCEGRNREVRRLWESQGLTVSRLSRIRFGPISLSKHLRRGRWEDLAPQQIADLYQAAGLTQPVVANAARTPSRPPSKHRQRPRH